MARGIFLVGFSGSGKSTIAKRLGEKLQWPACDLDEIIAERSGMSISLIFEREGEAGFRLREAEALRAISSQGSFVVATGGGTIVSPDNRTFMAGKGWLICLEARPQTLLARIQRQSADAKPGALRPLLDAVDPLDQIRALKHARQSAYAYADWTVTTDRLTGEQVVDEVIRAIEMLENSEKPRGAEDSSGAPVRRSLNGDSPPATSAASGLWPYKAAEQGLPLPSQRHVREQDLYAEEMEKTAPAKNVAVFCAAADGSRPEYRQAAEQTGRALAMRGWGLIYGGAKVGCMGAVADAAMSAGGHVVGVIPHVLVDFEVAHHGVTELHVVDTMHTRKRLMGERASAFLILPGGFGTFEELFEVLAWQTLKLHNKPVVLINVQGFYDTMLAFLDVCDREGMLRGNRRLLLVAPTVEDAMNLIANA